LHLIPFHITTVALILFGKFQSIAVPCVQITYDTILDYIQWQKKQGTINDISINTNLRGVRAFFYYAMEKGYLPKFKIRLIRAVKPIKPVYTNEELEKMLKKPDLKTCNFKEYRTWVIINYALATGNRLETIQQLKIQDISFDGNEIALLKTKNKRQYYIPLSRDLSQILAEYLTFRKGDKEDILFCNAYGTPLKKRTIQEDIQQYNIKRGVEKTSIHIIRHTFAKIWIRNGGDIFALQEILGHSSLEMVKEYLALFGDDLKEGFNSRNPLDSFNRKRKQKGNQIRMRT